jgi:hypothetical protein
MNWYKDFAVFILTHGRADNMRTLTALKRSNYSGPLYYIVDNEDKMLQLYQKNFGEEFVKVFNKKEWADKIDEGNNFDERRVITHARNASYGIARELGLTYFMELDDDYTAFYYRLFIDGKPIVKPIKNLDTIIENLLLYYKSNTFSAIAMAQGGDFIGGLNNDDGLEQYNVRPRKCMNTWFCSVNREFGFIGAMNEDANTYTVHGNRGHLFLTIPFVSINQAATQAQKSGASDMYSRFGTYCKSFTTVMMHPSGVKVALMRSRHTRIHHLISWNNSAPKIISDRYKNQPHDL